jgi:hypothetical protein
MPPRLAPYYAQRGRDRLRTLHRHRCRRGLSDGRSEPTQLRQGRHLLLGAAAAASGLLLLRGREQLLQVLEGGRHLCLLRGAEALLGEPGRLTHGRLVAWGGRALGDHVI